MAKSKKRKSDTKRVTWALTICIFTGVIVAAGLAYFQSGVKRYRVERVLMSPDIVMGRTQMEPHLLSRSWVFERITFEYADRHGRRFVYAVAPDRYDRFYQLIGSAHGVRGTEEQLAVQFTGADALVLTLAPQGELVGKPDQRQIIQFAPSGDLFRIELPKARKKQRWAYFEHPGIETEARRLFLS